MKGKCMLTTPLSKRIERRRTHILRASYKNWHYLNVVYQVQAEFAHQLIHSHLTVTEVTRFVCNKPGGYITRPTVKRFFDQGAGNGKVAYSVRGPFFSTTAAIADALNCELKFIKRRSHTND